MSDPWDMDEGAGAAAAFAAELDRLRDGMAAATRDLGQLERGFAGGLRRAIDDLVLDGGRLRDALATVGRAMMDTVYAAAMKPVTDRLGGLLAQGVNGAVASVMPFAKGGVVSGATPFATAGGMGVMGEAGPEAIMPLARGPDGRLGVRGGGAAPQVTINVSTPDAPSFARSQAQIAADMQRLLARGSRNR